MKKKEYCRIIKDGVKDEQFKKIKFIESGKANKRDYDFRIFLQNVKYNDGVLISTDGKHLHRVEIELPLVNGIYLMDIFGTKAIFTLSEDQAYPDGEKLFKACEDYIDIGTFCFDYTRERSLEIARFYRDVKVTIDLKYIDCLAVGCNWNCLVSPKEEDRNEKTILFTNDYGYKALIMPMMSRY